ncbi:hypothetical protein YC2023_122495 [Brassica napus]
MCLNQTERGVRFEFLDLLRIVSVVTFFPRRFIIVGVLIFAGDTLDVITFRSALMILFTASFVRRFPSKLLSLLLFLMDASPRFVSPPPLSGCSCFPRRPPSLESPAGNTSERFQLIQLPLFGSEHRSGFFLFTILLEDGEDEVVVFRSVSSGSDGGRKHGESRLASGDRLPRRDPQRNQKQN